MGALGVSAERDAELVSAIKHRGKSSEPRSTVLYHACTQPQPTEKRESQITTVLPMALILLMLAWLRHMK